jgi:ribosomal protein S18 acetylase RimI-like enzyme
MSPPQTAASASPAGLVLRPIEPADRGALLAAFERLSPLSRYRRFLTPKPRLTGAELRFLTEPDPAEHRALVAVDPCDGAIVGVARFVRWHGSPDAADVAIAVIDDWQRRGVGHTLMRELIGVARRDGLARLTATTLVDNRAARGLLRALGFVVAGIAGETMDVALELR